MKEHTTELIVGIFVCVGIAALAYLSIRLGDVEIFSSRGYRVSAEFDSVSGLTDGAAVEIAGVKVGRVEQIQLKDNLSLVEMKIDLGVQISDDAIASIRTKGIIGEKFIKISPGGSDRWIAPGGTILDTESSVDIEELLSKYIFSQEEG